MKRGIVYLVSALGIVVLVLLLPAFEAAQPRGLRLTRSEARAIADAKAREMGIEVEGAFPVMIWNSSPILQKELVPHPDLLEQAWNDPVLSPRLGNFQVIYYRNGLEKNPPYGVVSVGRDGEVVEAWRTERAETEGASPSIEELRPQADQFLRAHRLPGVVDPQFESARPRVLRARTDHEFRYRVRSALPGDDLAYYVSVRFIGNDLAGWVLSDEYASGKEFRFGGGEQLVALFTRYGVIAILMIVLLVIFLRKYHAGEVGVHTGALLLGIMVVLLLMVSALTAREDAVTVGMGGVDARTTALAFAGIRFLFYDLVIAVMVFLGWSVGESYARERWGDRLASFDALVRHHPLSATVGRSLFRGIVLTPAVAAATLIPPAIGLRSGLVWPSLGSGTELILSSTGGAWTVLLAAASSVIAVSVVAVLFVLALFGRIRLLSLGVVLAAVAGVSLALGEVPVQPYLWQFLLGFGGVLAVVAVFLGSDLLTAATALFGSHLLVSLLPYLRVASGDAVTVPLLALVVPLGSVTLLGLAGIWTGREIRYEYDDLAPHVKRIVERERIRAEIDAANRIQSALLPSEDPEIPGISIASHYRAATEIGGDYFDFLPMDNGDLGVAFGDVAGHGLTSGIVMAMAKSALLVQLQYDASPRRMLEVLNETVIRTAPKRMMMTFFFGLLDPVSRILQFSSAGHLDPYVYRASTGRIEALSAWGYPLGIRRRDPFPEITVRFSPGDRLILYSDGLIEALNDEGEPFGFKRFEKVLLDESAGSAAEIREALLRAVKKFTRNRPPEDDQTLVVLTFDEQSQVLRTDHAGRPAAEPVM